MSLFTLKWGTLTECRRKWSRLKVLNVCLPTGPHPMIWGLTGPLARYHHHHPIRKYSRIGRRQCYQPLASKSRYCNLFGKFSSLLNLQNWSVKFWQLCIKLWQSHQQRANLVNGCIIEWGWCFQFFFWFALSAWLNQDIRLWKIKIKITFGIWGATLYKGPGRGKWAKKSMKWVEDLKGQFEIQLLDYYTNSSSSSRSLPFPGIPGSHSIGNA